MSLYYVFTQTSYVTKKNKGKQKVVNLDCVEVRTRKPKQANWENLEVLTFINAKKVEHEISLEVVDLRDNMETTITKWKHIFEVIMVNFHFHHHYNRPTYKDKWGSLYMTTKMLQATMKNTRTCLHKTRSHRDCLKILAKCFLSSLTSS
jgi:predicted metal-dependent RNase